MGKLREAWRRRAEGEAFEKAQDRDFACEAPRASILFLLAVPKPKMQHAMSEHVCPAFGLFDARRMNVDVAVRRYIRPAVGGKRKVLLSEHMASFSKNGEEGMFAEDLVAGFKGDIGA